MPLTAELENLVKELEKVDPDGAKAQRELLEKHAKLQESMKGAVLRQNEFDRYMNENKTKVGQYDQWKSWADKNMPIHEQLQKDYQAATTKIATLEADKASLESRIAAVAAVNNEDPNAPKVDPDKLVTAVRERIKNEYVAASDLPKVIEQEMSKAVAAQRTEFFDKTFPEAALWITGMVDAQFAHQAEFGKALDRNAFAKFLKEEKIVDPMKGYEKFVDATRTEKKINDEVTRQVAEKLKTANGGEFPGSSGAPQPMGALQVRLHNRAEGDPLIPKDAELGDGSLAMAAAKELRAGV